MTSDDPGSDARGAAPARTIELDEDLRFQRNLWRLERLGWALLALFVLGALLGAFGPGVLGARTAESGGLRVEYEPFLRARHDTLLRVRVRVPGARRELALSLPRAFLERVVLGTVVPRPIHVVSAGGSLRYVFGVDPEETPRTLVIELRYQADEWGTLDGVVEVAGASLAFTQRVYP